MKIPPFLRNALLAGMAIVGFLALQAAFLRNAFRQLDQLLVERLAHSVAEVLNEAHMAKDDLAIHHVLYALSKSPGVVQAFLIFPLAPNVTPDGYPLRDKSGPWGSLYLTVSDRLTRRLVRKQLLMGAFASSFLWGILTVFLYRVENRISDLCTEVAESRGLLELEKNKLGRSEEREGLALHQSSAALQATLKRLTEPLLLLNQQQRIWALNSAAAAQMNLGTLDTALQKSWHEIPLLAPCGKAIEQSLSTPGQPVEWPSGGLRLRFETPDDGSGGTWIWLMKHD